jgi:hypothetical protein
MLVPSADHAADREGVPRGGDQGRGDQHGRPGQGRSHGLKSHDAEDER